MLRYNYGLTSIYFCSTAVRLPFGSNSTALRAIDDVRYGRIVLKKFDYLFIYLFTIELNVHFFHTSTSIGRSQ